MSESSAPRGLAAELGVSASIVRRWLREHEARTGATWVLDDDVAARVRAHFAATAAARAARPAACAVDGCDRVAVGRGLLPDALQPVGPPRVDRASRRRGPPARQDALPARTRVHRREHDRVSVRRPAQVSPMSNHRK